MSLKRIVNLDRGVDLGLVSSRKYKSNVISLYFVRNISREEVTKLSLLTNMMVIGCEKYPCMSDISKKLDEFYGMSLINDNMKIGEKLVMSFKFLTVSDKYLDQKIFRDVLEFINEIVSHPYVVDKELNPEMISVEKDNLVDEIESRINDKMNYANHRCIEEMCRNELYSVDTSGYIEDVENITSADIYDIYREMIKTSNIFIDVEGDFDIDETEKICRDIFVFERGEVQTLKREDFSIRKKETEYVEEHLGTTQGKLVIGIRTGIDYKDFRRYYAMVVANSIFGGGAHSKLFNNVREKHSLCYYASSGMEKFKGIILVRSGIDPKNYDRALELIRIQFNDVREGRFSDEEMEYAKKSIINSLKTSYDSISGESGFMYNQFISGTNLTIDDVIEYISSVTRNDIKDAMRDAAEDTVYFLS